MANANKDKVLKVADFIEQLDDSMNVHANKNIVIKNCNLVKHKKTVTVDTTMDKNDSVVFCSTATTLIYTLLAANTQNTGPVVVINAGTGTVVIQPIGKMLAAGESTTLYSDDTNWFAT